LNQFHDILPGSSIKEVYENSKKDYENILADLNEVTEKAIHSLLSNISIKIDSVVVLNSIGFERNDAVQIAMPENLRDHVIFDDHGDMLLTQILDNGHLLFYATDIPAMGYKIFTIKEGKYQGNNEIFISEKHIHNSFIDIKLNQNAEIISLFDKQENREILKDGCRGNVLQAFEDKPFAHDAWDINIYYSEKMWEISDLVSVEIIEQGPVRACLEIHRKFLQSTIVQRMYVYSYSSRIDFETIVDWKETHILLKVAFPVNIHSHKATYEIQFGNVERATHWNTSWDYARFEVCAQKWVDLSEGFYGVSMLNDCKYGHDIKDGIIRQTLIKSPKWPNEDSDREIHTFTYSIYPHRSGWIEAGTVKQAYFLNSPVFGFYKKPQIGYLPSKLSFISINADNVVIETVKKAECDNSTIIRIFEYTNKRTRCRIDSVIKILSVYECDLLENETSLIDTEGSHFTFEINPYEIKTFKIAFV
jgi:alpha-mannosidase